MRRFPRNAAAAATFSCVLANTRCDNTIAGVAETTHADVCHGAATDKNNSNTFYPRSSSLSALQQQQRQYSTSASAGGSNNNGKDTKRNPRSTEDDGIHDDEGNADSFDPNERVDDPLASQLVSTLHIGDVSVPIYGTSFPERIPSPPPRAEAMYRVTSPDTMAALRWIAQKETIGQDVCLMGEPGPCSRWLALTYCHYARRQVKLLTLSRDTTEADIKQRKEIRSGELRYVNQPAVSAALNGQILVLEGLEKAERNVLPVINNLLENREMHLDNGMMLIHPARYDQLAAEHHTRDLSHLGLLRVSERFRVIAITVPVPKYPGNPLDPPLRSRFQCFYVHKPAKSFVWETINTNVAAAGNNDGGTSQQERQRAASAAAAESIMRFKEVLTSSGEAGKDRDRPRYFPDLGDFEALEWAKHHSHFPHEPLGNLLCRVYPWELHAMNAPKQEFKSRVDEITAVLNKCRVMPTQPTEEPAYTLCGLAHLSDADVLERRQNVRGWDDASAACSMNAVFACKWSGTKVHRVVPVGSTAAARFPLGEPAQGADRSSSSVVFSPTICPEHVSNFSAMVQSHACERHMCLVGPAGCGKTMLVRYFSRVLGYGASGVETMQLYSDMNSRDLFQRRCTDPDNGDTTWSLSPLLQAAKVGKLAVLDGVESVNPGTLAVLQELLVDGEASLFDGSVFKRSDAYEALKAHLGATDEDMARRRVFRIHPSFRVVAIAKPPSTERGKRFWLTPDLPSSFDFHVIHPLSSSSLERVLTAASEEFAHHAPDASAPRQPLSKQQRLAIKQVIALERSLRELGATDKKIPPLSLRHALRAVRFAVRHPHELYDCLCSTLLVPLMSPAVGEQVRHAIAGCGVQRKAPAAGGGKGGAAAAAAAASTIFGSLFSAPPGGGGVEGPSADDHGKKIALAQSAVPRCGIVVRPHSNGVVIVDEDEAASGEFSGGYEIDRVFTAAERTLVPHVSNFYPNPLHAQILKWLTKNLATDSKVLLVGNQGVGKNKIVDFFLNTAGLPRHYVQLHRDTTVASLTVNPTVVSGRVQWEDSPLVKAVKSGHILVVDEVDKAPVEVVQVLKGLIEDKEMVLSDGRRISGWVTSGSGGSDDSAEVIPLHKDFKLITLANPPGFPFHGNDFYRECGDLFACYVVENPDSQSQHDVLSKYAPNLPKDLLAQLVAFFIDLGTHWEAGQIQYPFSLRELIHVARHLHMYPQDGLFQALNNVFNFDLMDAHTMDIVRRLLHKHIRKSALSNLVNACAKERDLDVVEAMLSFSVGGGSDGSKGVGSLSVPVAFLGHFAETRALELQPRFDKATLAMRDVTTAAAAAQGSGGTSNKAPHGLFTETRSWFSVPPAAAGYAVSEVHGIRMFDDGLVTLLVTQQQTSGGGGGGAEKKLSLVSFANPCPDVSMTSPSSAPASEALQQCPLAPGRTCSVDLQSAFFVASSNTAMNYSVELPTTTGGGAGEAAADAAATSVVAFDIISGAHDEICLVTKDALQQVNLYFVNPVTGRATVNLIFDGSPSSTATTAGNNNNEATCVACTALAHEGVIAVARSNTVKLYYSGNVAALTFTQPVHALRMVGRFLMEVEFTKAATAKSAGPEDAAAAATQQHPQSNIRRAIVNLQFIDGRMVANLHAVSNLAPDTVALAYPSARHGMAGSGGEGAGHSAFLSDAVCAFATDSCGADGAGLVRKASGDLAYAALSRAAEEGAAEKEEGGFSVVANAYKAVDALVPSAADTNARALQIVHRPSQQVLHVENASPKHPAGRVLAYNTERHTGRVIRIHAQQPQQQQQQIVSAHVSSQTGFCGIVLREQQQQQQHDAAAGAASGFSVAVLDMLPERLSTQFARWTAVLDGKGGALGAAPTPQELKMWYSGSTKEPSGHLKHGKEDQDNKPHVGGNTWAGGTGGTDTAGLGGLVGPYRLDKGHKVHQVDEERKRQVPQHIIDEAKSMGKEALGKRLKEIQMSPNEDRVYRDCFEKVQGQVVQLQLMLNGLKAKEGERTWQRHQTDGVWDDSKLVEAITGERSIYKRRTDDNASALFQHKQRKRLLFVFDVSASMYRFNGMDQRLNRLVECAIMVMEAFVGHEEKIDYSIVGHNGDSDDIKLVPFGEPPKNKKDRMKICQEMVAHSQFCWRGDNTVRAMKRSINTVLSESGDSYFVFVVSDANLAQYGITPKQLSNIILEDDRVNMYALFIASFGGQAQNLQKRLPAGRGYDCMDTAQLPLILKQIFVSADLLGA